MARRTSVEVRPHTGWAAASTLRSGVPVVEVKRLVDGHTQRFRCELVHATTSVVVLLYRLQKPRPGLPWPLLSYGFYWPRRPYLCYQFVQPSDGSEVASRFDVVGRVDLVVDPLGGGPVELRFNDLLLDLWVQPRSSSGTADELRWEDEGELHEAIESGLLSPAAIARVERARAILTRGHYRVRREVSVFAKGLAGRR